MTQADAEAAIVAAGLVVGTVTTANSATVASGDVISQNPGAGTNAAPGSAVDIEVSLGPAAGGGGGGAAPAGGDGDNFFGCSLGSGDGPVDPTLPILLLVALMFLTRRGWMRVRLF
jgi:serine/threonine-protein kinase